MKTRDYYIKKMQVYVLLLLLFSYKLTLSQSNYELIKFKHSNCYKYFNGKTTKNSSFSGFDTISCNFLSDSITIIQKIENGSVKYLQAYYSTGDILRETYFNRKGEKIISTSWHKNGNKKKFFYGQNTENILKLFWYETGILKSIVEEKQHLNNNYRSTKFDSLGQIQEETYKFTNFDSLGQIQEETYKLSPHSEEIHTIVYYPSKIIMEEIISNSGRQEYKAYHKNGSLMILGYIFQVQFARIGKWQEWYESGIKKREYFFHDTIPNYKVGTWSYWDEEGNLIKQEIYENNELIETKEFIPMKEKKD